MSKQKRGQRKIFTGGKEFIADEIIDEELEKLNPKQEEWQIFAYLDDGKRYKIRRTREYLEAEKLSEQIKKEQEELGIDDWLDKNKPELSKERRLTLRYNARTIYYNY